MRTTEICREPAQPVLGSGDLLLFDKNPLPMFIVDAQTLGVLKVNEAAVRQYGYTQEEFATLTCQDIVEREDFATLLNSEGKPDSDHEWFGTQRHRLKDGRLKTFKVNSQTLEFEGHKAKFIAVHDVTSQVRVESFLRRSLDHFRSLVENITDIVCVLDTRMAVQYSSPSVERILGYTPAELLNRNSFELLDPESEPGARRAAMEALENPGVASPPVEVKVRHRDGSWRHMVARGVCPPGADATKALLLTLHDISQRKQIEQSLRESEEHYRRLFELIPDAIILGREGRIIFTNPAALKLFGATRAEELVGRPILPLVHPATRELVAARIKDLDSTGTPQPPLIERFLRLDGKEIEVEVAAAPMVLENKRAALVIMRDLTHNRRIESELRKLSQVIEQTPNSVVITDRAGRMEYVNSACCATTGYSRQELLGQTPRIFKSGLMPAKVYQELWATLLRGEEWEGELCNRKKDGTLFWEAAVLSALRDEQGRVTHFIGIKSDITARRQAEEALRESKARLQLQFDRMPIGCICWDTEFRVTAWNPSAEKIFGYTAQEMLGDEPFERLVPPRMRDQVRGVRRRLLSGDATVNSVNENLTKEGRVITCEWTNSPLLGPGGEVIGVLSMVQDVTEKMVLQKQVLRGQRLESIGTLAAGVAHDLNNILTPILMSSTLLERVSSNSEEKELLANIGASARRGAEIVRQVLTFARGADSSRQPLQPRHLLEEIGHIIHETFPKNLSLWINTPPDLWLVNGDSTQLHQVLMNLCVNARDAMPEGGKLTLHAQNIEIATPKGGLFADGQAGPHVLLEVADTGQGIPPAVLEKVFDPFFTTKALGKGTGLGLSTVLGIVRGHGGFVDVQSEPGQGSVFRVYLPALPAQKAAAPETAAPAVPRAKGERILVVDDETDVRTVTQRLLTQHGYRALGASNGREALELLSREEPVQAMVTDIMMPGLDGPAFLREVKQIQPGLPVIACTGYAPDEIRAKLKGLGVPLILQKPFASESLLQALHEQLAASNHVSDLATGVGERAK